MAVGVPARPPYHHQPEGHEDLQGMGPDQSTVGVEEPSEGAV